MGKCSKCPNPTQSGRALCDYHYQIDQNEIKRKHDAQQRAQSRKQIIATMPQQPTTQRPPISLGLQYKKASSIGLPHYTAVTPGVGCIGCDLKPGGVRPGLPIGKQGYFYNWHKVGLDSRHFVDADTRRKIKPFPGEIHTHLAMNAIEIINDICQDIFDTVISNVSPPPGGYPANQGLVRTVSVPLANGKSQEIYVTVCRQCGQGYYSVV